MIHRRRIGHGVSGDGVLVSRMPSFCCIWMTQMLDGTAESGELDEV